MNQDGNKHETQGKTKMHGGLIKKKKKNQKNNWSQDNLKWLEQQFEMKAKQAQKGASSIQQLLIEVLLRIRCHAKSCGAHKGKKKERPCPPEV